MRCPRLERGAFLVGIVVPLIDAHYAAAAPGRVTKDGLHCLKRDA